MLKHLQKLILVSLALFPWVTQAQTLNDYSFSTGVDTTKWIDMSTATQILTPSGNDGLASSVQSIGFSFPFGASTYTQYSVNTDGNLRLGPTVTGTGYYTTPFSATNANNNSPKINAFGCDGYGVSGTHYAKALNTVDANGNSLLVVEFCMGTYNSTTRSNLYKWQVHMFADGDIEIVYGPAPAAGPNIARQPGLCVNSSDGWTINGSHQATHFTAGVSTTTVNLGSWPTEGRYYRFAKPNLDCPKPLAITASNIDATSFDISWTDTSTATSWIVQLFDGDSLIYDNEEYYNNVSFTGLSPASYYIVQVAGLCMSGDTSSTVTVTVRTSCSTLTVLPFVENFDSYTTTTTAATGIEPDCWTLAHRDVTMTDAQRPQIYYNSSDAHSNNYSLRLYYRCIYAMPAIDTNISALQMSFWVKQTNSSYRLIVGVMSDLEDETSFVPVDTIINSSTSAPEYHEVHFNNYTGDGHYIAFRNYATASYNYSYNYIDDIVLDVLHTCLPVQNIAQTEATTTSVTLNWTEPGQATQWVLEYDTVDFVPGTSSGTVVNVTALPYTLNGLDSGNSYYIYVHGDCGTGDTSANVFVLATTLAGGGGLPYTCDFEGSGDNGWDLINGSQTNKWYVGTAAHHTGNKGLYISSDNGASNTYDGTSESYVFAVKEFSLESAGEYAFSYDWKCNGESSFDFLRAALVPATTVLTAGSYCGFNNTSGMPTDGIALDGGYRMNQQTSWQIQTGTFLITTPGTYKWVFLWRNDGIVCNQPPAAIDNLMILYNDCPSPLNLSADTISSNSATIHWTPGGNETSWIVSNGTDVPTEVSDTAYTFTNLNSNTSYTITVRAICGIEDTSVANTIAIRTACSTFNFPYVETFEDEESFLCWESVSENSDGYWGDYGISSYVYSDMYETDSNANWLISPTINLPLSCNPFLYYQIQSEVYGSAQFANYDIIISSSDSGTLSCFTDTIFNETLLPSSRPLNRAVSLSRYAGHSIRIALRHNPFTDTAYSSSDLYLYRFEVCDSTVATINDNRPVAVLNGDRCTSKGYAANYEVTILDGSLEGLTYSWNSLLLASNGATLEVNGSTAVIHYQTDGWDTITVIVTNLYGADTLTFATRVCDYQPASIPYNSNNDNNGSHWWRWTYDNAWCWNGHADYSRPNAMYISNNRYSYAYDTSVSSNACAYRVLNIEQPGRYVVRYDWKGMGENSVSGYARDYLRLYLVPLRLGAKNDVYTSTVPSQYIALDGNTPLNMQSTWINHVETISIPESGLYALYVAWRNNTGGGQQPPAAVDNIQFFAFECNMPHDLTTTIMGDSLLFTWHRGGYENEWLVEVNGVRHAVMDTFYVITNYSQQNTYTLGVASLCGEDTSIFGTLIQYAGYDRYYVTQTGNGNMDGSSWQNAMNDIQSAINAAVNARNTYGNNPEIWVAVGTYYGDTTSLNAFTMIEGINLYGGFVGDETQLTERLRATNGMFVNQTILDGQYTRRVLYQPNHFNMPTVWNGFTLQHGNVSNYGNGGGAYLQGNGRLEQCLITDNYADNSGGGVYCNSTSSYNYNTGSYTYKYPHLNGCIISNNTSQNYGGGIYSVGDSTVNCLIVGNNAYYGGGFYSNSNGHYINYSTIARNNARYGGGIYNRSNNTQMRNSILWNNTSSSSNNYGQYYCYTSFDTFANCAVEGAIPSIRNGNNNIVLAHANAGTNEDSNYVFFVSPNEENYRLADRSSCINAGNTSNNTILIDIAGNNRTYGIAPDIGCYEWNGEAVCLAPFGLIVSNVAQTSAMVSWHTYSEDQNNFRIQYRAVSDNDIDSSWATIDNITAHRYMLTGLVVGTTYEVKIISICDSNSSSAASITFSTIHCAVDNVISIGEASTDYGQIPFSEYPYTYTQELILSNELPQSPIHFKSISLQYWYDEVSRRNVDIYLGHTSRHSFDSLVAYVPIDSLVLVYSGFIDVDSVDNYGWITMPFSSPFTYDGSSNIVVAIDDNTGNHNGNYGYSQFSIHPSPNNTTRVCYYHIYDGCPNISPSNPIAEGSDGYVGGEIHRYSYRNNMRFDVECDTTISCYSPNLIVEDVTDSSATILWANEQGATYELQYKNSLDEEYTVVPCVGNSYTFTNLAFNTEYIIRMRQLCNDGDTSNWKVVQFTTSVPYLDKLYVKENATGNGSSWSNATGDLNWALVTANVVKQTYGTDPVIWVAQGTYYGDTTAESAFTMVDGINVYGGFSGNGTEYDPNTYVTILDGQNARRVLYQPNVFENNTYWSGFTIQHGSNPNDYGGGALLMGNGGLSQCVIVNNNAYNGAGVCCSGISNYDYNIHEDVYLYSNLFNCKITNNTSYNDGGGVYCGDYTVMYNCLIANNTSSYSAGGIYQSSSNNHVYNCDIVNNSSDRYGSAVASSSYFFNCIIWGNRSTNNYSPVNGSPTMYNCAVEGGYSGTGNVPLTSNNNDGGLMNPHFVHPSSGVGVGYYDGDWHLMDSSACVNRGLVLDIHTSNNYDLDGNARTQQRTVDIGCYESPYQEAPNQHHPDGIMYVKVGGSGNGTSWDNAMGNLADALQLVPFTDAQQVWVAEGTYTLSSSSERYNMIEGVNVYGGFVGNEAATYDVSHRDVKTHPTILQGTNNHPNGHATLYQPADFSDSTVTLWDGFIIRGGTRGVYIRANAILSNSIVTMNGNRNSNYQGGLYATIGATIINTEISDNYGYGFGGVYSYGATFINCLIHDNTAYSEGDGVYDNGNSTFRNCNIVNNNGSDAGRGVYLANNSSYVNCIIWGNGASSENVYVYNDRYYNNGYYGYSLDTTSFTYCAIEGGRTGEGNIPLPSGNDDEGGVAFEDPNGNDYHLTAASVCIGTGSNDAIADSIDLDGNVRIYDSVVDMGVYELQYSLTCPAPRNPRVVSADSTGAVIAWSGEAGATYRVKYYSAINPLPVFVTVSDTTITLPNIAQGSYYWRVQRYCSATDTSLWAKGPSFCTVHPEEPVVQGGSYKIYTPGQLMWIASVVNGTITTGTEGVYPTNNTNMSGLKVELMNNIDITGIVWNPIGNYTSYYRSGYGTDIRNFNGEFDGGDHSVINPCLLDHYANFVGLFGYLSSSSSVHDLSIEGNVTIYGNSYVGAVAGCNFGSMTNVYNRLNVEGMQYVGGLAGYSNDYYYDDFNSSGGTYTSVYNTGNICGERYVGGVSGYYGRVINAYNRGTVNATGYYAGGIIGYNGTVYNAYNTGTVTASNSYSAISSAGSRYNTYYLEGSCTNNNDYYYNGTSNMLSDYQMQHPTFVSTLNLGQTPAPWRSDFSPAINDGYPILNYEEHEFTVYYTYSGSGSIQINNGSLSLNRGDRVANNTLLSVTATPQSGYRLTSFMAVLGGNDTIQLDVLGYDTLRVHSDVNIMATFQPCNAQLDIDYLSASHFIDGQTAEISWQIRNVGSEATCGSNWYDYVILSTDSASFYIYSNGNYYFNYGNYMRIYPRDYYYDNDQYTPHPSYLEPGQSYSASCTYNVPYISQYNYRYIFLISGNQYRCIRIERDNSPTADLNVETVVAPTNMFAGSQVSVMTSVNNIGQNRTSSNQWTDAIYMSFSPTWNYDSATLVGTFQHTGHLHVDSSYSIIFNANVPERYYGTCYFYVLADYNGEVRDYNGNNNLRRSAPVNVFMANPSDLTVLSFTADHEVSVGNCLNYSYQFGNNGTSPIVNKSWQDIIFLVPVQDTTRAITSTTHSNYSWYGYYDEVSGWHYSDTMVVGASQERSGSLCVDRWSLQDNGFDTGYYYLYLMLDYEDNIFEYNGEANNFLRLSHPIHVIYNNTPTESAVLVMHNLNVCDTVRSGARVNVEYDIVNQSIFDIVVDRNIGYYYIVNSNGERRSVNTYNGNYHYDTISAGDGIHVSCTLVIPPYLTEGNYRIMATRESGDTISATKHNVHVSPYGFDLSLTAFQAPASIAMGDSITLSWTVQNISDLPNINLPIYHSSDCASWRSYYEYDENGYEHYSYRYYNSCTTYYSSGAQWYDRIYLSSDSIFSSDDQQLTSVEFGNGYWYYDGYDEYYITDTLYPGNSYNRSVTVAMPYALQGNAWLLMIADGALTTYDANRENNIIARPITINRAPLPDLRIENFSMDTIVKAGNSYTLTYTVSNVGSVATPDSGWSDAFYIGSNYSRSNATMLSKKAHNTILGVGESYTDTVVVTIPTDYTPGYYFIIAQTDADYYYYDTNYYYYSDSTYEWWVNERHASERVFEFDMESNNLLAMPVQVARPDAVDLAVFEPQLPAMVQVGGEVTASWRLNNQGNSPIQSTVQELIYLSTDGTLNSNAVYIGFISSQVTLGVGESETHTYTFRANGIIDGQYHIIVQTDASHTLLDDNRSNNTAASLSTMTVNIPTLVLGQVEQTIIDSNSLYYKLVIPQELAHQNITVQSKTSRRNATSGLFVSRDALPKSSMAQYADQTVYVTDRTIFMTDIPAGTYYIMLQNYPDYNGSSVVTLLASVLTFDIVSVVSDQASNTGSTTVEIRGSQFDTVMDFRLVKEGVKIPAEKVTFVNSTKVYATFNLTDQLEGTYSLEAELPGGATTSKENCFTVRQGVPSELLIRIMGESAIVVGSTAVINIEYSNMGESDIPIPALFVDGGEHYIALDADSLANEQHTMTVPIASDMGSVRPGESGIITIYVKAASTANLHLKVYGMREE